MPKLHHFNDHHDIDHAQTSRWKWSESASTSPEHRRERDERETSEDGFHIIGIIMIISLVVLALMLLTS